MLDISEIMTPREKLVVIDPEATIAEARRIMNTLAIRHLPVVDGSGELVGLVSQTDVLVAGHGAGRQVHEIMVREIDTTDERNNVRHVAMKMLLHKRSCMPVMRDGKLRGIVTDSDFLGVAITLMEQLETAEPEELEPSDDSAA